MNVSKEQIKQFFDMINYEAQRISGRSDYEYIPEGEWEKVAEEVVVTRDTVENFKNSPTVEEFKEIELLSGKLYELTVTHKDNIVYMMDCGDFRICLED